jgi:hypothetical protein
MSAPEYDLEARIAQELKNHEDPDFSWGKWYCSCGVILRGGHTQMVAHRKEVERRLRGESAHG